MVIFDEYFNTINVLTAKGYGRQMWPSSGDVKTI